MNKDRGLDDLLHDTKKYNKIQATIPKQNENVCYKTYNY